MVFGYKGISEYQTRKKYIDTDLKKVGWLKKYIKEEVNSVKSDFVNKRFKFFDGNVEKGVDRFIDYILLNDDNTVLAIIEAKRFSKDSKTGRIQARSYSKDISQQVGYKIPIFLTNGEKWYLIDEDGIERRVSGSFSQEDLKRRRDLYKTRRDLTEIKVDLKIVDRDKSRLVVTQLSEHFSEGHRSALIQMATGTGKTRVSMAIIKLLINANIVRNVLFIADRITLVNQAKANGFNKYFGEVGSDLRDGFSKTGQLYVSTIQTLMGGKTKKMYERFSPGFFDLIVFDEAHRSIYDKNNLINKYFDALKIGLTATPRQHETRNTYNLFGCVDGKPTVEYSYDEAVRDGVLVPYKADIIETKVLSLGIKGGDLNSSLKNTLRRQEKDPETSEFTGSQFDRVFMDNKTNELVIREFMKHCYKSDEGKPCKTIFFCASQRHADYMKTVFGKIFPKLSNDVQVITSKMSRAEDEVKRFQRESEPRIALSVGMLDTGVDIPEICNLVFIKPVFSSIRFWQMVGRGTRSLSACKHKDWLPNKDKKDFFIFDFKIGGYSNIEMHEFEVSKEKAVSKDVITKIFDSRVILLKKKMTAEQKNIISSKVMNSINCLDENSFIVRERLTILKKIKSNSFDLDKYLSELKNEISPLMILNNGSNPYVSSFILKTEKLFGFVLDKRFDQIEKIKQYVYDMVLNVLQKDNLVVVKNNKSKLVHVLQDEFWNDLTFDDIEFMISNIAPLMLYFEPTPKKIIRIDAPDIILNKSRYVREIKEDVKLKQFLNKNTFIKKIKDGTGINSIELQKLESQLVALRPELTIKNIQKFQDIDFLLFLRKIIGLTNKKDPKKIIETHFDQFIIENNNYNSKQMEFLLLLKKVFSERKHIVLSDFAKPPLSDERPSDYFKIEDLKAIVDKCNGIKMC